MYYLYSVKMNGWITTSGTYVSELDMAATFSYAEAYRRVKSHYDGHSRQFMVVPVSTDILDLRP